MQVRYRPLKLDALSACTVARWHVDVRWQVQFVLGR